MKALMVLVAALFCISSHAAVVKCKDPTGKVVYSDVACPTDSTSSSVNLSGGNITEAQARAARERSADNGGAACPLLKERAEQAFARYQEIRNLNSSNASIQALQNLGSYCPSAGTCDLIRRRVNDAQLRYDEIRNRNAAAALDSSLGLLARYCGAGGGGKQTANNQASSALPQIPVAKTNEGRVPYTKDEFGTLVRSDKCFRVKNEFGVYVPSLGCAK